MAVLPWVWYGGREFAASILYSVLSGDNVEIWMQDTDSPPVLITTVPKRVALGWSFTGSGFESSILGYVRRPTSDFCIDDIRDARGNTGIDIPYRESYEVTYDGPYDFGQSPQFRPIEGFLSPGGIYYLFTNGSNTTFSQSVLIGMALNSGSATAEVVSISNYVAPGMAKGPNDVFVSLRVEPYHDEVTPSSGDIYNSLIYWDDGTLTTFLRANSDVPVGNPLDPSTLDYIGTSITTTLNTWDGITYNYGGDIDDLINGGVILDSQPVTIASSETVNISIRGVTTDAYEILAVRVVALP